MAAGLVGVGPGRAGTHLFQLVLDVGVDDADNLFDWLSASTEVYYDLEREAPTFGSRPVGQDRARPRVPGAGGSEDAVGAPVVTVGLRTAAVVGVVALDVHGEGRPSLLLLSGLVVAACGFVRRQGPHRPPVPVATERRDGADGPDGRPARLHSPARGRSRRSAAAGRRVPVRQDEGAVTGPTRAQRGERYPSFRRQTGARGMQLPLVWVTLRRRFVSHREDPSVTAPLAHLSPHHLLSCSGIRREVKAELTDCYDRARLVGYRPGSPEMADLARAEACYQLARNHRHDEAIDCYGVAGRP